MIQNIPLEQVHSNPYQTRVVVDDEHLRALADDIAKRGLLQVPIGRWVATAKNGAVEHGHVELSFGHSRFAAWQMACPGEPFPVDVRELTDREMSDLAAAENAKRKNLTAIETARAILRRVEEFHLTQLEAAEPFGYTAQGSISNLLRLLKLPSAIQDKVQSGDLSERIARRLIPVARVAPEAVEKLAAEAMQEEPGEEREEHILEKFGDVLRKKGESLDRVPWDLSWPKESISAEKLANPSRREPNEIPACRTCEFFVESAHEEWCTRVACLRLKARVFALKEAERLCRATGIAIAGEGEKVTRLGDNYSTQDYAKGAMRLKSAREWLRLIPIEKAEKDWNANHLTGSYVVGLGTVDEKALRQATKPKKKEGTRASTDEDEDDDEESEGIESQSAQDEKRRAQAAKFQRAASRQSAEDDRLLAAATKQLQDVLPKGGLLDMLAEVSSSRETLKQHLGIEWDKWRYGNRDRAKKPDEAQARLIVMSWLLDEIVGSGADSGEVRKGIEETARSLKVKLTKGWDSLASTPYLRTEGNCWRCGAEPYTSYAKIAESPTELERGWIVRPINGAKDVEIICPECAEALPAAAEPAKDKARTAKAKVKR